MRKTLRTSLCLFLFFVTCCIFHSMYANAQGVITTIIGNGMASFGGDETLAVNANLTNPSGVVVDGGGNMYIADTGNNRIRMVNTDGIISTVAGNGNAGFSGDEGAATEATLNAPIDVALDAEGNLYISDNENHRIRKVNTLGVISTVAGNGNAEFNGDGGSAIDASLNSPKSIIVDGNGNLFIADNFNHRIRMVSPNGIITTVAGNGNAFFGGDGGPATEASIVDVSGVFVDEDGIIFISGARSHRVRKIGLNGIITTVAGNGGSGIAGELNGDGGAAVEAQLSFPIDVFGDNQGNIFIADQFSNNSIRKVDTQGIITTVAGNSDGGGVLHEGFSGDGGPATEASLGLPSGVFADGNGNLFIADFFNNRIRKVDTEGIINTVAGNGDPGFGGDGVTAAEAGLNRPTGVIKDNAGNIFVVDSENHRIRKVNPLGEISTVAGNGDQAFSGDGGPATEASLSLPRDIAFDSVGNMYIADEINHRIRKVDSQGIITTVAGNGEAFFGGDGGSATDAAVVDPTSVFVDGDGNIFIVGTRDNRIRKVDINGIINTVAGDGNGGESGEVNGDGGPATEAQLSFPSDVFVDGTGNIFIADQFNNVIRMVNQEGIITTVAGTGNGDDFAKRGFTGDGGPATDATLAFPAGVFVDNSGNLYIADQFNNVIRKVNEQGIIDTIVGTGDSGFSGDGGSATEARLSSPGRTFVDSNGNILIADTANHRIRMVDPNEVPPSVEPDALVLNNAQIEIPIEPGRLLCRGILVRLLNGEGDPVEGVDIEVANVTSINSDDEIVFVLQNTARTNFAGNAIFSVCGRSLGEANITFTTEPNLEITLRVIVGNN